MDLGDPTMFFITHYKKHHTNICLKLIFSFVLTQKKEKVKTENSFCAKSTATTSYAIQAGKAQFWSVKWIAKHVCALPSGSLHCPSHKVHCLVLQQKEFKVEPNNKLGLVIGSA